jgi:Ca-activated chloride channel family protein
LTAIQPAVIFSSRPSFTEGRAVLYSSDEPDAAKLPEGTFSRLEVRYPSGAPDAASLKGLTLWLYVGDLATPRAVIKLEDLARMGGARPLNVARQPGEVVLLVLDDEKGLWAGGAPQLEVSLR